MSSSRFMHRCQPNSAISPVRSPAPPPSRSPPEEIKSSARTSHKHFILFRVRFLSCCMCFRDELLLEFVSSWFLFLAGRCSITWTYHPWFIHFLSVETRALSRLWELSVTLLWTFLNKSIRECRLSCLLGQCLRVESEPQVAVNMWSFRGTCRVLVSSSCTSSHPHRQHVIASAASQPPQHLVEFVAYGSAFVPFSESRRLSASVAYAWALSSVHRFGSSSC